MSFNLVRPTDLKFVTAGSIELTIGVSKFLYGGGTAGAFYVQDAAGSGPVYRLPYFGAGAGGGVGVSAAGPVTLSVSLPWQWGGGIGRIYQHPLRRSTVTPQTLVGTYVTVTAGAGILMQASATLVFVGAPRPVVAAAAALTGPASVSAFLGLSVALCEGFGAIWGTAESSAISAGITVYTGMISHCGLSDGETG